MSPLTLMVRVLPFNFSAFDRFSQRSSLLFQWVWCLEERQEVIWVCMWAHQGRHLCFTAEACPSLGWHQSQIPLRCSYPAAVARRLCKDRWFPTSLRGLRRSWASNISPHPRHPSRDGESQWVWAALLWQGIKLKQLLSKSLKVDCFY